MMKKKKSENCTTLVVLNAMCLDYIYSGAMYLCGAHMQYVIQVEPYLSLPKSEKTLKTYIV